MKLKKYLTLTRAGVIESLQFRLSTLIMIVGNLLYLIIVYFLWNGYCQWNDIYRNTHLSCTCYSTVWFYGNVHGVGDRKKHSVGKNRFGSFETHEVSQLFVLVIFRILCDKFLFHLFSNISDCNVCYTRCDSYRYQSVVICSVSDNGSSDKLQCRFYCGNNLSLYGVNMGHQYYETGGCSSVVRSNNTTGFLSGAFEDNGISSSISVDLQCTAFYFAVYFIG